MFKCCSSLEELNINNFNTTNVEIMEKMFSECQKLKTLNINNFDININTEIKGMFWGCSEEFKKKMKDKFKNINDKAFCYN